MEIWIPEKMYRLLPWICLVAATMAWMLPAGLVVIGCSAYLYGYGGLMLFRRVVEACRYN